MKKLELEMVERLMAAQNKVCKYLDGWNDTLCEVSDQDFDNVEEAKAVFDVYMEYLCQDHTKHMLWTYKRDGVLDILRDIGINVMNAYQLMEKLEAATEDYQKTHGDKWIGIQVCDPTRGCVPVVSDGCAK